ncbi:MAG: rhodanese-like domain-containing protein [Turneriella sp.]|nr:rhodanese-like domain-containing protein [Turneriella sp.]
MVEQITVHELKAKIERGDNFILLDVRTHNELDICRFENALHIPLHELARRFVELDPNAEIIITCHHGGRSQQAAYFLLQKGFRNVSNLVGGIDAWAALIDTAMARY